MDVALGEGFRRFPGADVFSSVVVGRGGGVEVGSGLGSGLGVFGGAMGAGLAKFMDEGGWGDGMGRGGGCGEFVEFGSFEERFVSL